MRWVAFLIVLFLTVVLELSLKSVLAINAFSKLAPSFVIVLIVFIALQAPRLHVMWAALLTGLLLDLSEPMQAPGGEAVFLIGPNALGYVAAAFLILQMRSVVFRQRLVTVVVFTFLAFLTVGSIRVLVVGVRGWFGEELLWGGDTALGELMRLVLIAVYTCLISIPFGWVLLNLTPIWAFHSPHQRVTAWR